MSMIPRGAPLACYMLCFLILGAAASPLHAAQGTLRPEAVAVDGIAHLYQQNLYQQSASSVVRSESTGQEASTRQKSAQLDRIRQDLQHLSTVAALAHFKTQTCSAIAERQFNYTDDMCGIKLFRIADMLDSYNVEQGFWAGRTDDQLWKSELSAWRGGKDPKLDELRLSFYKSGADSLKVMVSTMQAFGLLEPSWVASAKALDFGCGLGGNSNALARLGFKETICVDQAQTFLNEANRSLEALQGQGEVVANVRGKLQFLQSSPDLLCSVAPNSIDFVHSVGALQHMKPLLQVVYIEQFCDALRVAGSGYFQIPVKINAEHPDKRRCDLGALSEGTEMHYTPKSEVVRHLRSRGCRVLSATVTDSLGQAGTNMQFIFDKP